MQEDKAAQERSAAGGTPPAGTGTVAVRDHNTLFSCEDYRQLFEDKKYFEDATPEERVKEVLEWTKSWEYRELNLERKDFLINPAKACQPLGGILAAFGFRNTLPLVHGSQGCVAYFRSHFSRHYKEPFPTVSSSMTEDAAVFGGMKNLREALQNALALYRPEMIAICTTCMAEVIGDDLGSFIQDFREEGVISEDLPLPWANTPSFVGSHIIGYDNMMRAILADQAKGKRDETSERINIIPGFDTYTGNLREIKRLLDLMEVPYTLLGDTSDALDSPALGEYQMYPGGTPLSELRSAAKARATIALQRYSTRRTMQLVSSRWKQEAVVSSPIGVRGTDAFLQTVSRLTGKRVPKQIQEERGRVVDAMLDSHAYTHGRRVALIGDPDLLLGVTAFLLEVGAEPVHIVCTNGDNDFKEEMENLLAGSPYGQSAKVWVGYDMWHLRSLVFTEPVDLLIGNSYLKLISREADVPLVRVGFPIFDRHHLHRNPIVGYRGALNLLQMIVNTVLEELDRKAPFHSFDVIR
ncbi:MAG: nitrogenase molybdenum-iron protein subunit beta [Kyrpidia tusciae]|nr:nitrogenase molybdenum-iron protein subunit beta [Kyrpidia tusciae]MBE3553161.1 nitrogenase molybdenum-iron protein subunit beta [Kyrpidia tusciae]